jgi:N-acetylmuramoyl-L-alanine amidase
MCLLISYEGRSRSNASAMPATSLIRLVACAALVVGLAAGIGRSAASGRAEKPLAAVAVSVALTAEVGKTRLAITLSKPVEARAAVMERPDRVIVDLPEVNFQLPPDSGQRREGVVASYRYGLFAPGRSRLVIELAQPARVERLETAPGSTDGAAVLTIELARTDREAFKRAAAADARLALATPAALPPEVAPDREDRRPLIVIDPGHGGIDPGAHAPAGSPEKDIVFAFSQRLKARLEAKGRYRVVMTREDDVFIPLLERVRIARAAKADLLISIHADTISGAPQVRGLTVYTGADRASDAESAQVADRENKSDAVAGLESEQSVDEGVADILQDLIRRETRGFSHAFAGKIIRELSPVMKLNVKPHREARFVVLRAPDVPAVLVELGYLSSTKDTDLLMSDEWRDRMTASMSGAIDRFFSTRLAKQGTAPVSP